MDTKIIWNGDMSFVGVNQAGFSLAMDAAKEAGGHDSGMRPTELVAIGLGGCTGMDVISILQKKKQQVTDFQIAIHVERAAEHPKVFTKIIIEYIISGKEIDPQAVARAVELSETKYCSVGGTLQKACEIEHKITIHQVV